jgi:O-antigen ligase
MTYNDKKLSIFEKIFTFGQFITPLGLLIVKSWIGGWLFLQSLMALLLTLNSKENLRNFWKSKWMALVFITFILPLLAILNSQLLNNSWEWRYYDSPSRFLFAVPLIMYIWQSKIKLESLFELTFPLTLIVTFIALPFLPKLGWGADPSRLATYFVDPLTFGRISLTFGLVSLAFINFKNKSLISNLVLLIGFILGLYLSVKSGSRTGWLAAPIVFIFLFVMHAPFKNKFASICIALLIGVAGTFTIYKTSSTVNQRVNLAIHEVSSYQLNQLNPDNSVGMRISFFRMGLFFFSERPLSGWGDESFKEKLNATEISFFSSSFTREFALNAGFHNEFITNMVRSGVLGLLSSLLLIATPLIIFWRLLIFNRPLAIAGVTYVICELISGLSTEVFNLKFTAALYTFNISVFLGLALQSLIQKSNE